jgi:tetratricopeptide (TPR) repeat protein
MVGSRFLTGLIRISVVFAFLLLSGYAQSAFGQSTIAGFIFDKQRNPLVDIDVELMDDYRRMLQRAKTDSTGRYSFDGLADGRYTVRVYAFRYDLEDQEQPADIYTSSVRGGQGTQYLPLDFYLLPRRGGLAEAELAVVFAQDVPSDAKKLYEQAVDLFNKKKPNEGIDSLNAALKIFPTYFMALFRVGKELYVLQSYEESARFMYKAVEVNPKSGSAFYYLGSAFFKMGKDYYPAALAALNQAQLAAPASTQVLWALGRTERALGKFADAERHLLAAKKAADGGIAEIHKELAELYSNDLKRYAEAADEIELYIKAAKLNDADAKKMKAIAEGLRAKAKKT